MAKRKPGPTFERKLADVLIVALDIFSDPG
jgi:hypothetical protein